MADNFIGHFVLMVTIPGESFELQSDFICIGITTTKSVERCCEQHEDILPVILKAFRILRAEVRSLN